MLSNGLVHPRLPVYSCGAGISTELGTFIKNGEVVAYVHHSGRSLNQDEDINTRIYTTLNAALAVCRSGRGDVVIVLPGHAEDVDAADDWSNLVAGTRIIGLGHGNLRPTFTWSAATSTVLLNVANVSIVNCILEMSGDPDVGTALTVAAPMTISAAGCSIIGCKINCGVDADRLATIAITTTAAADDLSIVDCWFWGGALAAVTTMLRLVGADRFYMSGCYMYGLTSAAGVGVLDMETTESLNILIENSAFVNIKSDSTAAASGIASATGVVRNCEFGVFTDSNLQGFDTEGNIQFFNCVVSNQAGENGAQKAPQST